MAMHMDYPEENSTIPAPLLLNTSNATTLLPLEESIDNCTHLFTTFKLTLEKSGQAGIVAIHLDYGEFLPDTLMSAVSILLRILGRKMSGRVGGTLNRA